MISKLTKNKTNLQMSATARRDHPPVPFWETKDDLACSTAEEKSGERARQTAGDDAIHISPPLAPDRQWAAWLIDLGRTYTGTQVQRTVSALRKLHPRANLDYATGEQQCSNNFALLSKHYAVMCAGSRKFPWNGAPDIHSLSKSDGGLWQCWEHKDACTNVRNQTADCQDMFNKHCTPGTIDALLSKRVGEQVLGRGAPDSLGSLHTADHLLEIRRDVHRKSC